LQQANLLRQAEILGEKVLNAARKLRSEIGSNL
jgi:hypothetical protein